MISNYVGFVVCKIIAKYRQTDLGSDSEQCHDFWIILKI